MTGNPIEFSEDEQAYILARIGPGPGHESWGEIARQLNIRFSSHNLGKRSRNGVWMWVKDYTTKYPHIKKSNTVNKARGVKVSTGTDFMNDCCFR